MGILGSSLSSLGGGFQGLGSVISGFAAGGVVGAAAAGLGQVIQGLQWATKEAEANQQAWVDLQAALKLTGPAWDNARTQIESFASSIQKTTTFSDEMVVGAVQRLTTFGMSYQQAMSTVGVAVDFAAAKHLDLQTAVDILGKVFAGNTSILTRYGVSIDDLKQYMGSGETAATGFSAAMELLGERFGGTAQAQAESYAGVQERLKNAMSDLGEKIGGMLLPALAGITEGMIPVVDWIGKGIDSVQAWITAVQKMPEVKAATDAVGVAFQGFQKWLGDVASTAMTELGPALQELWLAFKDILDALSPIGEAFAEIWAAFSDGEGSGNILKDILGLIADNIKLIAAAIRFVAPYIKMLAEAFKAAAEFIIPTLLAIRDAVGGFLSWLHDAFEGFYNFLVGHSLWQDLWNGLVSVVQNVGPIIGGIISGLFTLWNSIISGGMEIVKGLIVAGFQLAFDTITTIISGASTVLAALIGVVTSAIGSAQKGWTDLSADISGTSDKIRQLIQNLWDWLSKFWQDRLTDMVTRSNDAFLKLTTGIQATQAIWTSTLSAMESTTRSIFNTIVSDISSAVDAIIARLNAARSQISSHSIWPDMLSEMLQQTREGLGAIQGEFANAITGPVGIVPSLQTAELPAPTAASQPQSMTQQLITVPIHVYLDGTEIQTLIERRLIENLNQQGKSVRS